MNQNKEINHVEKSKEVYKMRKGSVHLSGQVPINNEEKNIFFV